MENPALSTADWFECVSALSSWSKWLPLVPVSLLPAHNPLWVNTHAVSITTPDWSKRSHVNIPIFFRRLLKMSEYFGLENQRRDSNKFNIIYLHSHITVCVLLCGKFPTHINVKKKNLNEKNIYIYIQVSGAPANVYGLLQISILHTYLHIYIFIL